VKTPDFENEGNEKLLANPKNASQAKCGAWIFAIFN
jgi:hypothetical protein